MTTNFNFLDDGFNVLFQKKAKSSHQSLAKCSSLNDLPLYNQPSDTDLYYDNKRR